ncbi:PKD domain-containing protein [Dehalococcoidia bacterium]|nr:PKD domain-containing protein [Dehalococcoidia bacterium]
MRIQAQLPLLSGLIAPQIGLELMLVDAKPAFADIDNDGDHDLAVGGGMFGHVGHFRNDEVRIYSSPGTFISSTIDTTVPSPDFTTLDFTIDEPLHTDIKFQLRTATTEAGLTAAPWLGPDGTATTYYEVSGTAIHPIHDGHRFIQYKAFFSTINVLVTPALLDVTLYYELPTPVSARIDAHTVSPRNITVGESVTIGFTFTNTGDKTHTFGAGATLRRDGDDVTRLNFLEAVTVAPGESETVNWTHTIDTAGKWEIVFGVWEESTHPLENLVAQTGWVDEYITAVENQPPVAIIERVTDRIVSGEPLLFDALNSYDPDGTIVSYHWDFGDGTTAEGSAVTHRFRGAQDEPKTYTIRLTVQDDLGATATETVLVTVDPIQITVEIASPAPLPGFDIHPPARVRVYYNWIGITDIHGQDDLNVYMISKIHFEAGKHISYHLSVWDHYEFPIPTPIWSGVSPKIPFMPPHERVFVYPFESPHDWKYRFGDEYFKGMVVLPSDTIRLLATRIVEGGKYLFPWVEWASAYFDPDLTEQPIKEYTNLQFAHLASPGELRAYDSEGRVTGLVDGEVRQEIPYSIFNKENNIILIYHPTDTYYFEVAGIEDATYGLTIMSVEEGEAEALAITDVPTTDTTTHRFVVDPEVPIQAGVTMKTDADDDGVFEEGRTLQPPIASFAYFPDETIVDQPITFNASGSSDPDGEIISYEWDFGDGTSGTGKVIEHTFALAGDYTVTLTIADNDGVVSSFSKMVTVAEAAVDPPAPAVDPPAPAVDPPDPAVDPPVPAVDPPARLNWGIIGGIAAAVVVAGLGIFFLVKRRRVAQQE